MIASPDNKTLQFIDNGIGMTAEEVEKYINQIAFSGAAAFLEQYKDKATEEQIDRGHFGLGFYSAFTGCLIRYKSYPFPTNRTQNLYIGNVRTDGLLHG